MNDKLVFDSLGVVKFESLQEFIGHRDKSFLWPWQEPVNVALREQWGELLGSLSEFSADWGETKNCVEIILNTVNEIDPKS